MTRKRLFKMSVLLGVAACSSTGPGTDNVTGLWTASWSLGGNGPSCVVTTPMTLAQTGNTFNGTSGPGTMTCGTDTTAVVGTVTSGVVAGDSVAFDIDDTNSGMHLHQVGKLANNAAMSGTSTGAGGPYTFGGPWTAHR